MATMYVGTVQPDGFPVLHLIVEPGLPARIVVPSQKPRRYHAAEPQTSLLSTLLRIEPMANSKDAFTALSVIETKIADMRRSINDVTAIT